MTPPEMDKIPERICEGLIELCDDDLRTPAGTEAQQAMIREATEKRVAWHETA